MDISDLSDYNFDDYLEQMFSFLEKVPAKDIQEKMDIEDIKDLFSFIMDNPKYSEKVKKLSEKLGLEFDSEIEEQKESPEENKEISPQVLEAFNVVSNYIYSKHGNFEMSFEEFSEKFKNFFTQTTTIELPKELKNLENSDDKDDGVTKFSLKDTPLNPVGIFVNSFIK